MAQPLHLLVERGVLLDVGVGLRDVRLGLVVVVVGDEVLHGVLREELPELVGELGRQGLVGLHHQDRPLHPLGQPGHGRRLAGAGGAEQDDVLLAGTDPSAPAPRSRWAGHRTARSHSPPGTGRPCAADRRSDACCEPTSPHRQCSHSLALSLRRPQTRSPPRPEPTRTCCSLRRSGRAAPVRPLATAEPALRCDARRAARSTAGDLAREHRIDHGGEVLVRPSGCRSSW